MKKENTIRLVLLLFVLALMSIMQNSCQLLSTSGWKQDARIDDFINLKIEKIILCDPDDEDIEKWTPYLEITEPEKISKVVYALKNAKIIDDPDKRIRQHLHEKLNKTVELMKNGRNIEMIYWQGKMKVITEDKKFIMGFETNEEEMYGYGFESKELLQLAKEYGLRLPAELKAGDPNNNQQRLQKLIELRMKRLKEKEPNSN